MRALWQPSTLAPQDAEAVVITAMRAAYVTAGEAVVVARKVPKSGAGTTGNLVVFTRDGGVFDGLVDRVRMRCRCFADIDDDVADLAALTIRLVASLVGPVATRVEHLSGPLDVTDESERPQRYLLFEIHLRGVKP